MTAAVGDGRGGRRGVRAVLLLAAAVGAGRVTGSVRSWRRTLHTRRGTYAFDPPEAPSPCGPLAARVGGSRESPGSPVVLLHGLAGSSRSWDRGYDRLAAHHRLVIPDLLGFGASPRPDDSPYTLAAHADAVAGCLDAAGADGPVVIAAHSFGTLVAVALARRDPARVRGIVAVAPPLFRDADHARARMLYALTPVERVLAMDTEWARRTCQSICCARPRLAAWLARFYRADLPEVIAVDGVRHTWTSYSRSLAELLAATARPEWVLAAGVPFRVLRGTLDPLPDPDFLGELADSSPQVTVDVLEGADHVIHLSHPELVIALLEELDALGAA